MTPFALLVRMLTGTGSKFIIALLVTAIVVWLVSTMYESRLRIKTIKQQIILNDIAIAKS